VRGVNEVSFYGITQTLRHNQYGGKIRSLESCIPFSRSPKSPTFYYASQNCVISTSEYPAEAFKKCMKEVVRARDGIRHISGMDVLVVAFSLPDNSHISSRHRLCKHSHSPG
jgi:hypothetical protein